MTTLKRLSFILRNLGLWPEARRLMRYLKHDGAGAWVFENPKFRHHYLLRDFGRYTPGLWDKWPVRACYWVRHTWMRLYLSFALVAPVSYEYRERHGELYRTTHDYANHDHNQWQGERVTY